MTSIRLKRTQMRRALPQGSAPIAWLSVNGYRLSAMAALLILSVLLAGCVAPTMPTPTGDTQPETAMSEAIFTGHAWIVTDPAPLLAKVPALPEPLPAAPEAPADPTALDRWAQAPSVWMGLALEAIAADSTIPPRAARGLMLLGVALNDALVTGAQARAQGMPASDDALIAAAAARVLAYTHPLRPGSALDDAETATWVGVWQGRDDVAGVLNGRQIGAAVADAVIAWALADGSQDLALGVDLPAAAPGSWQPTAPQYDQPQSPQWGRVRTVAVGNPAQLRAPAPPAWGSPAMAAEIAAFRESQRALDDAGRELARRWDGGMGTVTPPGLWVQTAQELVGRHRLGAAEAAGLYAALGVALHDAAVTCWESKYHYWLARPIQAITAEDSAWSPLLTTPPHPSYPSGHAVFSGAASAILAAAFPAESAWLARQAEDAARSRVLGGIHWPIDGRAGLAQGRRVGAAVIGAAGK